MRLRIPFALFAAWVFGHGVAGAQTPNAVVGAWERISARNARAESTQPRAPPAFLIFTSDGHWSQIAIPSGRQKTNKPVDQLTREELVARFQAVEARRGTYAIQGNKLTRKNVASADPNDEGTDQPQMFRIEGDLLIFNSPDPSSKGEARFRRMKQ